jgi:hypothetical protein
VRNARLDGSSVAETCGFSSLNCDCTIGIGFPVAACWNGPHIATRRRIVDPGAIPTSRCASNRMLSASRRATRPAWSCLAWRQMSSAAFDLAPNQKTSCPRRYRSGEVEDASRVECNNGRDSNWTQSLRTPFEMFYDRECAMEWRESSSRIGELTGVDTGVARAS